MRNNQHLIKEIVEANALKSTYNYYLASDRARTEVENATQIWKNLNIISVTLRGLYNEFEDLKKRPTDERRETIDNEKVSSSQCSGGRIEAGTFGKSEATPLSFGEGLGVRPSALQAAKAIMLFNADTRFSITE